MGLFGSSIFTSAFCTAWVVPLDRAPGWETSLVIATETVMVPWVTAAAVTRTLRLMTTVPVLALTTTRAGPSPGCTSRFSTMLIKATRWLKSVGARTRIETPSRARATSAPNLVLMAWMMALAVVKSPSRKFNKTLSVLSKELVTNFSTIAPDGIRAAVVTPLLALEPAALTSLPVAVKAPCAKA